MPENKENLKTDMAKTKTAYVCNDCGSEHSRWQGQCNACNEWNTITEVRLTEAKDSRSARYSGYTGTVASKVQTLAQISLDEMPRIPSGYKELDRVLGGG